MRKLGYIGGMRSIVAAAVAAMLAAHRRQTHQEGRGEFSYFRKPLPSALTAPEREYLRPGTSLRRRPRLAARNA